MLNHDVTRRQFLQTSAFGAAALCAGGLTASAQDKSADPYRGFRMGIQSYSLRGFDINKALETSKTLGLKYWEGSKSHIAISSVPSEVAGYKTKLASAGIAVIAYGVVPFNDNEAKSREAFDFAKAAGIETLSANPNKDAATFKLLDKLVEEYGINIAIHNHGPKALYDKIDDVVNAVKDHHPRVGACVDTGHYLRSKQNPVEALERLKDRVFGVHLKDVKDATAFKILGEGDLDVLGCLKILQQNKYKHILALEYEENPMNPVPDIQVCLENLRKTMAKLPA